MERLRRSRRREGLVKAGALAGKLADRLTFLLQRDSESQKVYRRVLKK